MTYKRKTMGTTRLFWSGGIRMCPGAAEPGIVGTRRMRGSNSMKEERGDTRLGKLGGGWGRRGGALLDRSRF